MSSVAFPTFSTLPELLTHLKSTTINPADVYQYLQKVLGPTIDVRCEFSEQQLTKGKKTTDVTINTTNDASSVEAVVESKAGSGRDCEAILSDRNATSVVVSKAPQQFRILLNTQRINGDYSVPLQSICNGLILEYPSWNVLALPSKKFNPNFKTNAVLSNLADYTVYPINDGTTCTLYYYDNAWRISSTNGFDIGDYLWMSDKSYWSVIKGFQDQYPDFKFDNLCKEKSYTVGFRHNDFHPLLSDPQRMWLIQSVDFSSQQTTNYKVSTTDDIGIPLQMEIQTTADDIKEKNAAALVNYLSSVRNGTPQIHYGYVLRSATGPDIMIESELLKTIRYTVYNFPKGYNVVTLSHENRLDYVILRAYLSCTTKYNFINLFPQFHKNYKKLDEIFEKLTTKIINAMRCNKIPARIETQSQDKSQIAVQEKTQDALDIKISNLSSVMVKHIESFGRINAMDTAGCDIINNFVLDHKYLDLYYKCLLC